MLEVNCEGNSFQIIFNKKVLIRHNEVQPAFHVGEGSAKIDMYRGNFKFDKYVSKRIPLEIFKVEKIEANFFKITFCLGTNSLICNVGYINQHLEISFDKDGLDDKFNRFWIRLLADKSEKVYGCGEQLSYFNLRGRNFPLWTSEPGVGRDKSTYVTWQADVNDKAGGDYYNTENSPKK